MGMVSCRLKLERRVKTLGNEFCIDADKKINKYKNALEEIKKYLIPNVVL